MLPIEKLHQITQRFEYLEARRHAGAAPAEIARISREYSDLKPVVDQIAAYHSAKADLAEAEAMLERMRGMLGQTVRDPSALQAQVVIGTTVSASEAGLVPALADTRRYFQALHDAVWAAMEQGRYASEATAIALPEFAGWAGHTERQGFNVLRAWRELEPLWLELPPDVGR